MASKINFSFEFIFCQYIDGVFNNGFLHLHPSLSTSISCTRHCRYATLAWPRCAFRTHTALHSPVPGRLCRSTCTSIDSSRCVWPVHFLVSIDYNIKFCNPPLLPTHFSFFLLHSGLLENRVSLTRPNYVHVCVRRHYRPLETPRRTWVN